MTKKNIESLTKSINRANAAFAKMTKAQQRVTIAKDVIAGIKAKRLVANHDVYLGLGHKEENAIDDNPEGSLQEQLKSIPECTVCAKGALFVCTVARRNQVKNEELPGYYHENWNGDALSGLLGGVFSPYQLRLIETEFEGEDIEYDGDGREINAKMFSPKYNNNGFINKDYMADTRLIAIMRNIIKNNGTFKPVAKK